MTSTPEFAAWVGIDWADQQHAVCVLPAGGGPPQPALLRHTPEAIAEWAADLRARYGGRPVAVCLEQARGGLTYALMQYDFLVLYPINPKQLAAYRQALHPSGGKSDPGDAELLACFLREHSDRLRAWRPDDATTRSLRLLTEQRRHWVEARVAHGNELRQRLKESYPLALDILGGSLETASALRFLAKFPTQRQLRRASPKQLGRELPTLRRASDDPPREELERQRVARIRAAAPLCTDEAVLRHSELAVRHLVELIRTLNEAIAECDRQIEELFAQHPDHELFASLPGAGKALAPRLAAACGTNRDKFASALELQQFTGIAPVQRASGKSTHVFMRFACSKFLRQSFHEFAGASIKFSVWARAYYQMRKKRGDRYAAIIRALAFKWQRIIFHCWKHREPYDEQRYLAQLQAAGSPLLEFLTLKSEATP
jgi:transposase